MLAKVKSGEAAARRDLKTQLVCERLTQEPQEDVFVNAAMQRGIDAEPLAFAAYEAHTGQVVQRSGFLQHADLMAGCSLDGHVGNFGGIIELKCPKSSTHLKYLRGKVAPADYMPQLIHNLWVTGAAWCDFVSFDDRFPPDLSLFVVRVPRESVDLKAYELAVRLFLSEVDKDVQSLRGVVAA